MFKKSILIGAVALISLSVWMGSQMLDAASPKPRAGRIEMPYRIGQALERMELELKGAKLIVQAQPRLIQFVDKDGDEREYGFAYGTLWRDGYPVVTDIATFHFEYRDERGSLFIRSNLHRSELRRIGYTMRIATDAGDLVRSRSLGFYPNDIHPESDPGKVVWAGLSG